ncbi:MAG: calcium/sodium antiporter [Gemmatimonadota bacterium]|nr:calcium/sodium antiporter [Gemmatimonadota bacterium]
MIATTLEILAGLALLVVGGEGLVRGSSALAGQLGVSRLAIGLTVVAIGTSAPELVVSLDAVLEGAYDISVGNVVGSNIANVALILGIAALLRPARVSANVARVHVPLMTVVSLALVGTLASGAISRIEGVALLVGLVAYIRFTLWEARLQHLDEHELEEFASATPTAPGRVWHAAGLVVGGLGALVIGARLLVGAAVVLATAVGVSEAAIGLTVVAVGTSLPELSASVVAARRGQGDIAVGNVVGSNLFNVLGIVGVTASVRPLAPGGIGSSDLTAMLAVALLLAVFASTRLVLGRVEGALLLCVYVGYVMWLLV